MTTIDLDLDHLRQAADEALTQPSDSAMWDERLYSTHGAVLGWAERGDDILEESNYLMVLEDLRGVAVSEDSECDEDDVIDATVSHWLVGSLRQLFVRVYDDAGHFTPVFVRAVEIADALRDYPVFDDSDFSEREWCAYETDQTDALKDAQREYNLLDETADEEGIESIFWQMTSDGGIDTYEGGGTCDWQAVADGYRRARDQYYSERGVAFLTPDNIDPLF